MSENLKSTYGLIGYPLGHSLSPLMHNRAFKELEVAAVYKLFPLKEDELPEFFDGLREKNNSIFGLNVTVPYKERVIDYLDGLSPYAQKVGAVNTIVITKKRKLEGFNTDGPGFLTHLKELGWDVSGKKVAIFGAGGASRAIITALCVLPKRPASIKLYDIVAEKAQELLSDLSTRLDVNIAEAVDSIDDLNIELADVLINATPVGMKKSDPSLVEAELLHPNMFVYDVVYNPAQTPLLKMAKEKGATTSNGLGMLFYQGVLAFEHWGNIELDDEIKAKMRESLEEGLKKQ